MLTLSCSSTSNRPPINSNPTVDRPEDTTIELFAPQKDSQIPRQRRVYTERNSKRVLNSIESDFNGDSRIDFVQFFDPSGTWVQSEKADLDGNGLFDVTFLHSWNAQKNETSIIQEIFDTNYDSKPDLWKTYNSDGELDERKLDRNHDSKPDYWEYYEKGQIIRVEQDHNSDGVPDAAPRPRITKP